MVKLNVPEGPSHQQFHLLHVLCATAVDASVPKRSSPLFIGAANAHALQSFCGDIIEVRVYGEALTMSQSTQLNGELLEMFTVRAV